jgi:4'-phosphopantetheinyl transferase
MPLLPIQSLRCCRVAFWYIDESPQELASQLVALPSVEAKSRAHSLEKMATQAILEQLFPNDTLLRKPTGKPFLASQKAYISITHSYPWVAVAYSEQGEIGIDIERPQERILRIAQRVMSQDELKSCGENIEKLTFVWAAKEAIYKCKDAKGANWKEQIHVDVEKQQGRYQSAPCQFAPALISPDCIALERINNFDPDFQAVVATPM